MDSLPTMEALKEQVTKLQREMLVVLLNLVQTEPRQNHGEHLMPLVETRRNHGEL